MNSSGKRSVAAMTPAKKSLAVMLTIAMVLSMLSVTTFAIAQNQDGNAESDTVQEAVSAKTVVQLDLQNAYIAVGDQPYDQTSMPATVGEEIVFTPHAKEGFDLLGVTATNVSLGTNVPLAEKPGESGTFVITGEYVGDGLLIEAKTAEAAQPATAQEPIAEETEEQENEGLDEPTPSDAAPSEGIGESADSSLDVPAQDDSVASEKEPNGSDDPLSGEPESDSDMKDVNILVSDLSGEMTELLSSFLSAGFDVETLDAGNRDVTTWMGSSFKWYLYGEDETLPEVPEGAPNTFKHVYGYADALKMHFKFDLKALNGSVFQEGDQIIIEYSGTSGIAFEAFSEPQKFTDENNNLIGTFVVAKVNETSNTMRLTLTLNNEVDGTTALNNCNIILAQNLSNKTTQTKTETITVNAITADITVGPQPEKVVKAAGSAMTKWGDFISDGTSDGSDGKYSFKWCIRPGMDFADKLIQTNGQPGPSFSISDYIVEDTFSVSEGVTNIDPGKFSFYGVIPYADISKTPARAAYYGWDTLGLLNYSSTTVKYVPQNGYPGYENFKKEVIASGAISYGIYKYPPSDDPNAPAYTVIVNYGNPTVSAEYPEKYTEDLILSKFAASGYNKDNNKYAWPADKDRMKQDPMVKKLIDSLVNNQIGGNVIMHYFNFQADYKTPLFTENLTKQNTAIRSYTEGANEPSSTSETFKAAFGYASPQKNTALIIKKDFDTAGAISGTVFKLQVFSDTSWVDYKIGNDVALYTTNSGGTATTGTLPLGKYKFVEVTPAQDYDLSSAAFDSSHPNGEFEIKQGDQAGVVVECSNKKLEESTDPGSLTVTKKVDAALGVPRPSLDIEFKFVLLDSNEAPVKDAEFTITNEAGAVQGTDNTDENGAFWLADGQTATFDSLDAASYTVKEVFTEETFTDNYTGVRITLVGGENSDYKADEIEEAMEAISEEIAVSPGAEASAVFANGYGGGGSHYDQEFADLSVTKTVVDAKGVLGTDEERDAVDFGFTLYKDTKSVTEQAYSLVDSDGNIIASDKKTDGNGTFTLKSGQKAIFSNLPVDNGMEGDAKVAHEYQVKESGRYEGAGFNVGTSNTYGPALGDKTTSGQPLMTGEFSLQDGVDMEVEFTNTYTPTTLPQSLAVKKIASGDGEIDYDRSFSFVLVDSSNTPVANQPYAIGQDSSKKTSGNGIFTLHNDETALFEDLDAGESFTVWEVNIPAYDGMGVDIKNDLDGVNGEYTIVTRQAVIAEDDDGGHSAVFVNTYEKGRGGENGELRVRKAVDDKTGGAIQLKDTYTFVITDSAGNPLSGKEYYVGFSPGRTEKDGSFTLQAGQEARFIDLTVDAEYKVSERDARVAETSLVTTASVDNGSEKPVVGAVPVTVTDVQDGVGVVFTNRYTLEAQSGELLVVKYSTGARAPADASYTFEITQGGTPVSDATYIVDGVERPIGAEGRFTLRAGQIARFVDLALDAEYIITEVDRPTVTGATLTTTNMVDGKASGDSLVTNGLTVTANSGVNVSYVNDYSDPGRPGNPSDPTTQTSGSNPNTSKKAPLTGDPLLDVIICIGAVAVLSLAALFTSGLRRSRRRSANS